MLLPPGAEGPEHTHHDVEEAFFVLEGQVRVGIHRGEDEAEYAHPRLPRHDRRPGGCGPVRLKNEGDKDALFCVVIGTRKPQVPDVPRAPLRCTVSPVTDPTRRRPYGRRHRGGPWPGTGHGPPGRRGRFPGGPRRAGPRHGARPPPGSCARRASTPTSYAADVADPASVDELAAAVRALGPLYGLVNNAALANGVGGK